MNTKSILKFIFLAGLMLQTSCTHTRVSDYKNEKPELKLDQYLNGRFDAHGIFIDRWGKVKKRFHVDILATWNGPIGTLDEKFTYSDGTKSQRIWTLNKVNDQTYTGTASDVIGTAQGEIAGNALKWVYTLALDVDGTVYHVKFDDWMYLMDDKVMLNHSIMSKWGFKLGEVILTFTKQSP